MSTRTTALYRAIAKSPVHLARITVDDRVLLVEKAPRRRPCLMVAWLDMPGMCNWEPMHDWADLVDELDMRGATPESAWESAANSRVHLPDGSEVVLLARDMTPEERAADEAAFEASAADYNTALRVRHDASEA